MKRFSFVFADTIGCPLGLVVYAAIKWDSGGAPWLAPMRINEAFLLVYTLEGKVRYQDDTGYSRTLEEGDLFLMPPGIPHAYYPLEGDRWSEFHMWLSGPVWDLWLDDTPSVLFLNARPAALWLDRLIGATGPSDPQTPIASWRRISALQMVLADMMGDSTTAASESREDRQIRKARELLEQGILGDPSLEQVANEIGMSYESFRKRFTELVGISPGRYRTRHLMQAACQMLGEERVTIKETAARLGFADAFHFSRRFKEVIGVQPSSFLHAPGKR